jgi:hypothetical protein
MGLISPSSDPSKLAPQDLTAGTQSARCVAEKCRECFVESGAAHPIERVFEGSFSDCVGPNRFERQP